MSINELICPVCNGLEEIEFTCPNCSNDTDDCGLINNYLGPYSPYDETYSILSANDTDRENEICIHLVSCPLCGKDTRVSINKIII